MILIFELHLARVKVNHHAKYLGERSFPLTVIVHTHRHTHIKETTLPVSLKWLV